MIKNANAGNAAAPRARLSRIALLLVGLVFVAAIVGAVMNVGEIRAFAEQAANAAPVWLVFAFGAQCGAFLIAALVWRIVLLRLETPLSLPRLFPLGVAKLFADQALPSAGVSGAVFIVHALRRRGVSSDAAFIAFVFGAVTFITAFMIASAGALYALAGFENAPPVVRTGVMTLGWVLAGSAGVVGFLSAVYIIKEPPWLTRSKLLSRTTSLIRIAVAAVASRGALFILMVALQLGARGLDALTLMLCFAAIGTEVSFVACLIAISIASLAATLAPMPMGLGPFESGLIAVMTIYGAPLEATLTAALLYRGLSLWLPLIPGFFIVQRELLLAPEPLKPPAARPV